MGLEDNLKCYPTYGPGRQYKITSALCHDIVYIVPFLNQNRNTTLTINLQLYIYYQTLLFLLFSKQEIRTTLYNTLQKKLTWQRSMQSVWRLLRLVSHAFTMCRLLSPLPLGFAISLLFDGKRHLVATTISSRVCLETMIP